VHVRLRRGGPLRGRATEWEEIKFNIEVAFMESLAKANAIVDRNVLKVTNMRYMV